MMDYTSIIASFIAIISLVISILNYYRSLEPALGIRIEVETLKSKTPLPEVDYITKINFRNASNNIFKCIDISLAFITPSYTSTMTKLGYNNLGPQDERIVSFPSSIGDLNFLRNRNNQEIAKLNITYSYKFLFQKKEYAADFKWNPILHIWEWS